MNTVKKILMIITSVLLVALITLSILGAKERTGYIEVLDKIEGEFIQSSSTDTNWGWVNGVHKTEKAVLFSTDVHSKIILNMAQYLSSGDQTLEIDKVVDWGGVYLKNAEDLKDFEYPNKIYALDKDRKVLNDVNIYQVRIRYYSKIFRNSDIYGVISKTDNLPEYIKSIKFDEVGSPFGFIICDKELSLDYKIDNISYTLKVKNRVVYPILLIAVVVFILNFYKRIYSYLSYPINKLKKLDYSKIFDIALPIILGILVFIIVFYNLKNAGWLFGDDFVALTETVQGKICFLSNIRLASGRFFPLGLFHYNLLIPFGNNPFAYYIVMNLFFITLVFFMYKLFLSITKKSSISFLFTVIFSLMQAIIGNLYYQIIFPESIILPLVALFIFCYKKGIETNRSIYFIISGFVCFYATYCKEPIFGMFLVFALTNLIFGYKALSKKQKYLFFFIIINALIFVSLYAYLFHNVTNSYAKVWSGDFNRRGSFLYYLENNYLFGLSILIAIFRGFFIFFKKDRKLLIYDAYLFSGVAYIFSYVLIKLTRIYFITPAYVPIFIAFAGYFNNIVNLSKNSTNKNIEYCIRFLFLIASIICSANLFPKMLGNIKSVVSAKKDTAIQTMLISALEDNDYKIYVVLSNDDNVFLRHHIFVWHVFISIHRYGDYNENYNLFREITYDDEINLNEKKLVYYGDKNKFISNEIFNINPEKYNYYPMWGSWDGGRVYGKTKDIARVEEILSEIRATNR